MKKKIVKPIVLIDFYNNKFFRFQNGKFKFLKKLKTSKKDVISSYISNSDLIIEPIDLSSSTPQEHIHSVIVDKIYEELRLDPMIDYGIYPIKTEFLGDKTRYQVIIINKDKLKEALTPLINRVKFIDYLIPAPLLYKVLYTTKKLDDSGADMFIYFGEKDTFVTFYYGGEYLYSKSINFSLGDIYDRMCQLAQEVFITYDEFLETLRVYGLKSDNERLNKLLVQLFNECFLNLNDVLIYTKRVYGIERINRAYIGFSWGYIDGIDSYIKNYLNLEARPISSIYTNEDPAYTIDVMKALLIMSVLEIEEGKLTLINATPYPRPLPLFKRPAGKMIGVTILATLFILTPVIYNYIVGFTTSLNNKVLRIKEREVTAEANRYKEILQKKREKIKALESAILKLKNLYNQKRGELSKVYDKKFNYRLKSEQLAKVSELLAEFDIKSREIKVVGNSYFIDVESTDDKKITAFVKKLVDSFNGDINSIDITEISYDVDRKLYRGVLEVNFIGSKR